jgi:ABC-2 type transport system permease protein
MTENISKIYIVAKNTFRDIIKSKIIFNVLFLGGALAFITLAASEFTYGASYRVALDVGLGTLSLSSLAISLFLGVGLLSKEIESRTIYMVVSRPVSRSSFVIGKIIGLISVLSLNMLLLSAIVLILFKIVGGSITSMMLFSILFIIFDAIFILFYSVIFSLVTNNVLSILFSLTLYVAGHVIHETKLIRLIASSKFLSTVMDLISYIVPNLYKINLKEFILYKTDIEFSYLFSMFNYSMLYFALLFAITIIIFNKKNLD